MKIQIIGSGSSGNAYIIGDGKTSLMLDCGLPIRKLQEATGHKISSLDACFITHSHSDHCKAHRDVARLGVDIYTHPDTIAEMKAAGHRYKTIRHGQQFTVGTFDILPFDLVHDVTNTGWLCQSRATGEKLVYVTDTMYLPYRFQGVNFWMIEVNNIQRCLDENVERGDLDRNLKHRIQRSHLSLSTVLDIFRANDMTKTDAIYLLHLSDNNSDEAEIRDAIQKATGAQVIVCRRGRIP